MSSDQETSDTPIYDEVYWAVINAEFNRIAEHIQDVSETIQSFNESFNPPIKKKPSWARFTDPLNRRKK